MHRQCTGREPTGLSSLEVGSSPSGGHSLLARYPETLTSATQTVPPGRAWRATSLRLRGTCLALSPRPRSSAVRETPIPLCARPPPAWPRMGEGRRVARESFADSAIPTNMHRQCTGREPTGLSSLEVGSSPSGGHSLLARYPETLTSATQTVPPGRAWRATSLRLRGTCLALSPRPRSSAVRETPIPPAASSRRYSAS